MKHLRMFAAVLTGLLAVRLVLMVVTPVFDPSEARYAAISANMARSGDFVVPRFTHEDVYQTFDGKPPLVFQVGGLFCSIFGTDNPYGLQFSVRLFPLISAILLLVILYKTVAKEHGTEVGRLSVIICSTCTAFFAASGLAMTDMTLTFCVSGALLLYNSFSKEEKFSYVLLVMSLLGAGMIVKGPVALVMFGIPVLVDALINHKWNSIFNWKWLVGFPLFLMISVPWFIMVEQRNPGSVWYFFYNENFMRFISHDYGDKYGKGREAFRGVSVLWAIVSTLPWTLLLPWKRPDWRSFSLIAMLSIIAFWGLTSRVLLYYLFPIIPLFAAYLAINGRRELLQRCAPWFAGVSALGIAIALIIGSMVSENMEGPSGAYRPCDNQYSYEFYHGTPPSALENDK